MAATQKIFAVQYTYVSGLGEERDVHRAAHREFLTSLGPAMVAAGAYVDDPSAALLLVRADSDEAVRDLLDGDPFKKQGLIHSTDVHEWTCAVGDQAAVIQGGHSLSGTSRRAVLAGLAGTGTAAFLTACTADGSVPGSQSGTATGAGTGAPASSPVASPSPVPTPVPELPGGGTRLFPDRRMVALYGTPGTGSLGVLGEQDVDEAIARAAQLAAEYQEFSEEPVIPAFEIIATVATAAPGPTGDYSTPVEHERLRAWVEAAGEADTYVVLDLQPGTMDFLTQAQMFEDLLAQPHVGLALDPEWRLQPGQRHMRQIGQVSAAEVNEVTAWLAGLVAEHRLPEKLVILHQFQVRMIPDREDVQSRRGLVLMVHADGNGTPEQKFETWRALKEDLPAGMRLGWKNFIDEDHPTFTPERTMATVTPRPWFISYQ